MYESEFELIDQMIDILMSKIYLPAEAELGVGGADQLVPILEKKLCLLLTGEILNIEEGELLSAKSVNAKKMSAFLGISGAKYLELKTILSNQEIQNQYYYARIHLGNANGYRIGNCVIMLTLAVEVLGLAQVKASAAQEFLESDEKIRKHLAAIYDLIFLRISDPNLRLDNGVMTEVKVILPSLKTMAPKSTNVCLENATIASPIANMLYLLRSLYSTANVVLEESSQDRQLFIEDLLELIAVAGNGKIENVNSTKAEVHNGICGYVCVEAQAILDAITILYPDEVAVAVEAKKKKAEIEPAAVAEKSESNDKEPESTATEPKVEWECGFKIKGRAAIEQENKDNKQEIDFFFKDIKNNHKTFLKITTYDRCIDTLEIRYNEFIQDFNRGLSEEKSGLIKQFIEDVNAIIHDHMDRSNGITESITENKKKLADLKDKFLGYVASFYTLQKSISFSNASSSSSNSDSVSRSSGGYSNKFSHWSRSSGLGDRVESTKDSMVTRARPS